MNRNIIKYYIKPHNVFLKIIKNIRDIIIKYDCSSLIFKTVINLPYLPDCRPGRCNSVFLKKIHFNLMLIFLSGNKNIILDSYYYLLTTITHNDFNMGAYILDFKRCQQFQNEEIKINFIGEMYLWIDLLNIIIELVDYFETIMLTYGDDNTTSVYKCVQNIVTMLINTKKLVENIIIENLNDNFIKFKVRDKNNLINYADLIFIPLRSICPLFGNSYFEFKSRVKKTPEMHCVIFGEITMIIKEL